MEKITIYDASGAEIPITLDLLKTLVKQDFPEMAIVKTDDVKILINKTAELQTIVSKSVEIVVIFHELVGDKLPKKITDVITFAPRLIKKITDNPEIVDEFTHRLETIQQIAPKYLDANLVNKLQAFAPKQIQQTNAA